MTGRKIRYTAGGLFLSLILLAVPAFAARQGRVTMQVDLKAPAKAKIVRLWVPYPMSDENQDITDVSISGNYTTSGVYRTVGSGGAVLYAEWRGPRKVRDLTYSFRVARRERVTKAFPATAQAVSTAEYRRYLDTAYLGGAEAEIRKIAATITRGKTTTLAKAHAVYDWVVDTMRRDPDVKGCGLGNVEQLLTKKSGKCADISSVFIALARASGVPARDIQGIRLPKGKEGDITKWQHCWAEFYLPGYRWVVVDPADVLKHKLEQKLSPAAVKPLKKYFFGAVDEDRIALESGDFVTLNPPQHGGPLRYFMYPYAEADGKPLNEDLFGMNIGYTIRFTDGN